MENKRQFPSLAGWTACSIFLILAGCLNSGGSSQPSSGDPASTDHINTFLGVSEKVFFDQATLEQIVPHKVECPGKGRNSKVCIRICHVPPGNHDAKRDKVLPLEAMKAHIGHGDYLGFCQASEEPPVTEEPPVSEEPPVIEEPPVSEEPHEDDETSSDDGGVSTQPIPNWCVPYFEMDRNCDGVVDSSGEPYL